MDLRQNRTGKAVSRKTKPLLGKPQPHVYGAVSTKVLQ
jgi:hypothetical protein